jgi:hypothetical protein
MRERLIAGALAVALGALTGCASLMPVTSVPAAPPATGSAPAPSASAPPSTPVPVPAGVAPSRLAGAVDSTTVSEAGRAVLASIPEPLAPGERVPPPATVPAPAPSGPASTGVSMPAPEAAYDTLRASVPSAEAPTDGEVPVPAPTQPLGDKPGTLQRLLAPDTSAASASPPASAPVTPPASAPPAKPAPAAPAPPAAADGCWRVQVGAPAERARADGLRQAAESQLMVPFVVEREKGLFKVRTRGCVSGEAADALKRRATLAGFNGVFRFVGGTR